MIAKRMIVDPDHLDVISRKQLLSIVEAARYSGVVSSHSWSTADAYPRIYRLGGFITPYAGSSVSFANQWKALMAVRDKRFLRAIGWGADMNGFGAQGPPRGGDNPNATRLTHSPTVFLRDLGIAYRASGRTTPIMDGLAIHPYQDNSSQPPTFQHPNSTTISIADYGKLVKLLGEAFDGTAQKGSTLAILYDEYCVESLIPSDHSVIYTGTEPTTTHPVDEATQAKYYAQAIGIAFCQPNVDGILLFHAIDETELSAWQSGLYYANGTPKSSLAGVGAAASQSRRGVIAKCDGLRLRPKLKTLAWPTDGQLRRRETSIAFTCDIDCTYEARLSRAGTLVTRKIGTATGGSVWTVPLRKRLTSGSYSIRLSLVAAVNTGATVSRAKNVRVP